MESGPGVDCGIQSSEKRGRGGTRPPSQPQMQRRYQPRKRRARRSLASWMTKRWQPCRGEDPTGRGLPYDPVRVGVPAYAIRAQLVPTADVLMVMKVSQNAERRIEQRRYGTAHGPAEHAYHVRHVRRRVCVEQYRRAPTSDR
eukprot:6190627-Pleurochrysis_carterae.AAC.1